MLIISHRYGFIFVKTRKTAGTSIEWYLNQLLGPDDVATAVYPPVEAFRPRNEGGWFNPLPEIMARGPKAAPTAVMDAVKRRPYYNHLPAFKIRARVGDDLWQRYFTFCVERNPWDKTVSYYGMKNARAEGGIAWDDFIDGEDHCHNLPHYADPRSKNIIVDRVLRYERLNDELGEVFGDLGLPFDGTLNERAKAGYREDRRPYQEWYDDEQRQRIGEIFAAEIELHGYRFGD
jgi:hypothetical protein